MVVVPMTVGAAGPCLLEGESGRDQLTASAEPWLAVSTDLFALVASGEAMNGPTDAVNWSLPFSHTRMEPQTNLIAMYLCAAAVRARSHFVTSA